VIGRAQSCPDIELADDVEKPANAHTR